MKTPIIFIILLSLFVSCTKDEKNEKPKIPPSDSLDVNSDAVFDFVIQYTYLETHDLPSSEQLILGGIKPLEGNQLLNNLIGEDLYLRENDFIKKEGNLNAEWSNYEASILKIQAKYNDWNDHWEILSSVRSPYFLGIKLKNNPEQIGRMLLELNTDNGKFTILNTETTTASTLIIKQ